MENTFIRELDINIGSRSTVLKLHQKIEGDVSCVVWDAAIILAKYLEKWNENNVGYFRNKAIIELGAGVGCVGITAAALGGDVTLSDLPEALPLLNLNVKENKTCWEGNQGLIRIIPLDWGTEVELKSPDIILLADCVYYEESVLPLIRTLKALARSDTEILVCQEIRDTQKQVECWELFIKNLKKYFTITIVPMEDHHEEFSSLDIVILKLTKL
ncbi:protein N-lysine methyltransferase METTL21D-like [Diorhabda sublineata]|uniref:protein N-lysine methyltransferase METTL21D-like n=1 Tax=Diorhabda sublineata TaxID=1163346 RepID=UPI0024E18ECF|nr:protein N-lysine methyltransferase METTL21D-like [Diorhabda sublineata]